MKNVIQDEVKINHFFSLDRRKFCFRQVNKPSKVFEKVNVCLSWKMDWFFRARQIFSFVRFFHFMNRKWLIEFLGHCKVFKMLTKEEPRLTVSFFLSFQRVKINQNFEILLSYWLKLKFWLISTHWWHDGKWYTYLFLSKLL